MPRYFFDFRDNNRQTYDDEGTELSGMKEARDEAVAVLPKIAEGALPDSDRHQFLVTVRDAAGRNILEVKLELTVEWLI